MRYTPSTRPLADEALDAIVVPVYPDGAVPTTALAGLGAWGDGLAGIAARLRLTRPGDRAWVARDADGPDLLLICAGPAADGAGASGGDRVGGDAGADGLRVAAMVAGRAADRPRVASLLAAARPSDPAAAEIVAEGWVMGAYRFDAYRTITPSPAREEVLMWNCAAAAVHRGVVIGEAAAVARDLVNTPAGDLPPQAMAERCRELGREFGFTVRTLSGPQLIDGRFGGLVAVGAGSASAPLLIELERGRPELPHLALVGKGITFDAGGLSLKTTDEMRTMKADMSGAASIVGALIAAERLGVSTHVKAYLACAENMPGASALRIGDVIGHRNGLTTEVLDTDCEGRLVLSDVLTLAAESEPTHLIDIATLSSSSGLGPELWAGLGTDSALVYRLLGAGAASGEPGWQLPLWDGYVSRMHSDVADLRNFDSRQASGFGAVYAGLYLRHFIGEVPWAHIDLGLTVMRLDETGAWTAGANGNGTRTLARYLLGTASGDHESGSAHHAEADN